jgi:hypothetical protein
MKLKADFPEEEEQYAATLRIPTSEQYAYIEIHHKGTLKSLLEAYSELTAMVKVGAGLESVEWNQMLDKYRQGKGMSADQMERMNSAQKWLIHQLDKSDERLKTKGK